MVQEKRNLAKRTNNSDLRYLSEYTHQGSRELRDTKKMAGFQDDVFLLLLTMTYRFVNVQLIRTFD